MGPQAPGEETMQKADMGPGAPQQAGAGVMHYYIPGAVTLIGHVILTLIC